MEKVFETLKALGIARGKPKEVDQFRAETKSAFDLPNKHVQDETPLLVTQTGEIVTIRPVFKRSCEEYLKLVKTLVDWINTELASERIIVQSLEEDLYDGLVLAHLVGKLYDIQQLSTMNEIIPSNAGQLQRLRSVLNFLHEKMQVPQQSMSQLPWSVELIHRKDELATMRLLIAIARHQHAPIALPESLEVDLDVLRTTDSAITHLVRSEDIAVPIEFTLSRQQSDEVDDLFENNPAGVVELCSILTTWVNDILRHLSLEIYDLVQLHDGVYVLMLIGFMEGFYVPAYEYHLSPKSDAQKAHNFRLALELLEDSGIKAHPRVRLADIVNKDLRSISRFLVHLYQSYMERKAQKDAEGAAQWTNSTNSAFAFNYDELSSS